MIEIKQSLTKEQIKIFEDLMNCKVDLTKTSNKKKASRLLLSNWQK